MSDSQDRPKQRSWRNKLLWAALLVAVCLPWLNLWICNTVAACISAPSTITHLANNNDPSQFFLRRLRFEQLIDANWRRDWVHAQFRSAHVNGDRIAILLATRWINSIKATSELLIYDLTTRRFTRQQVTGDAVYVLLDGERTWLLPPFSTSPHAERRPFLCEGRPVAVVTCPHNTDLFQLREFVNGEWRDTQQYVILPGRYAETFGFTDESDLRIVVVASDHKQIYFRTGLPVGSSEEALQFDLTIAGKSTPPTSAEVETFGWKQSPPPAEFELNIVQNRWSILCGRWTGSSLSLLTNPGRYATVCWYDSEKFRSSKPPEIGNLKSLMPIQTSPWMRRNSRRGFESFHFQGGPAADGKCYFAVQDLSDGQIRIIQADETSLKEIDGSGSPVLWMLCLDASSYALATVGIPILYLMFVVWLFERSRGTAYLFPHEDKRVALASAVRRGVARIIDLLTVGLPVLLAILGHRNVYAWWRATVDCLHDPFSPYTRPTGLAGWQAWMQELFLMITSVPFHPGWMLLGLLVLICQIIWQGRTGQTLGKWLCGVRVLTPELRPCGWARSLLRELFLVFDSLLLLCWIPGVARLLLTKSSQRFGDAAARTIVVSERRSPDPA